MQLPGSHDLFIVYKSNLLVSTLARNIAPKSKKNSSYNSERFSWLSFIFLFVFFFSQFFSFSLEVHPIHGWARSDLRRPTSRVTAPAFSKYIINYATPRNPRERVRAVCVYLQNTWRFLASRWFGGDGLSWDRLRMGQRGWNIFFPCVLWGMLQISGMSRYRFIDRKRRCHDFFCTSVSLVLLPTSSGSLPAIETNESTIEQLIIVLRARMDRFTRASGDATGQSFALALWSCPASVSFRSLRYRFCL